MKCLLAAFVLCLISFAFPATTYAHGEIVYSARYYLPPGSTGHSHYHIYRIDPDGTHRVQLTFGNSDDTGPNWLAAGKQIQFTREINPSNDQVTMVMDAGGSRQARTTDDRTQVDYAGGNANWSDSATVASPNGDYVIKSDSNTFAYNLIDKKTNKTVRTIYDCTGILWLSNYEFAGLSGDGFFINLRYTVYAVTGVQKSSVNLTDITTLDEADATKRGWSLVDLFDTFKFQRDFQIPGTYLGLITGKQSDRLYFISPTRKLYRLLACTNDISWDSKKRHFCASIFCGTQRYQHRTDGTWRMVYTGDIVVIGAKTLHFRSIVDGLVNCDTADWLQESRR